MTVNILLEVLCL